MDKEHGSRNTPPPPTSPRSMLPSVTTTTALKGNHSKENKNTFLTATSTTTNTASLEQRVGSNNNNDSNASTNEDITSENPTNQDHWRTQARSSADIYRTQQQTKVTSDSSTGPLLRSLELRFQIENELVHVVDKLRTLHDRHTSEEFYRKIHELEKYKLTVHSLKEKLDKIEAKNISNLRKIADLEQDKAGQLVEIMKLRESALDNSKSDHEERALILKEKDEEIVALNEYLKEVESNLGQAKTHVREYRERCEKAEVQMHEAIDGMKTVENSAQLHKEKNAAQLHKLETRLADAEEYRSSVNSRLSQMEDEVSTLNSTILKLKGELNRSNVLLEEEKRKSKMYEEKVQEANETVEAMYSSSREQRSDEVKSREELHTMKRELAKLKSRDKARFNEGALQVATVENDRLRNSLVEGQKQIDMLEKQNIQLTRKLADQVALVERTNQEMNVVQNESKSRIERLENNIRVLCQNIESSNSILSMRSRKTEEPKRVETKAEMVRREMEEWQNNHAAEKETLSNNNEDGDDSDLVNEDDLKYLLSSSVHSKGGKNISTKKKEKKKKKDKMSPYLQSKNTPVNRRTSNAKVSTPSSRSRNSFVDEIRENTSNGKKKQR